jgi:hypothetical protein
LITGSSPVPTTAYSSRIASRINAIYSAIPFICHQAATYLVPAGSTADVGTVDATTSITVGVSI